MSGLLGCARHRRLLTVLGLTLGALMLAPGVSGAAQLDTVTVTGSASRFYSNVNISAQSGTSGQNPSGNVSFTFANALTMSGPVTSLTVTGSDSGGGKPAASTVAIIGVQTAQFGPQMIKLVDDGGNGMDTMCIWPAPNPDCTTEIGGEFLDVTGQLTSGRAVVFDAPLVPTATPQCRNGGWRTFTQFESQRQCVAFVVQQARASCVAERAMIGRAAFRAKYGRGRYHRNALRRCIKLVGG